MDPKEAKKLLVEHSKALNVLLHNEGLKDIKSDNIDADETLDTIEDREEKLSWIKEAFKKAQKIPAIETISNLGVAGTVAVSSAVVTQTEIAKDTTETFVAEVAQDIVEERIEVPIFIDNFVDFEELYLDWGQQVIAQKYVDAQSYTENVSERIQSKIETGEIEVTKPNTSSSSPSENSSSLEQQSTEPKQPQPEAKSEPTKEVSKESQSSTESEQKQDKAEKQQQSQEQKTEGEKQSQEKEASSEPKGESKDVKSEPQEPQESQQPQEPQQTPEPPRVETPMDLDNSIRQVSPIQ
jgi:outer membrane biosynthesis protein TonB